MLEKIMKLSSLMNVSGAEHQIIDEICTAIPHAVKLPDGSAYVFLGKMSTSAHTVMISAPVDVSGFLALSMDDKAASLVSTSRIAPELYRNCTVVSEDGKELPITLDKNDNATIPDDGVKIGDVFRLKENYSLENGRLIGMDSSIYANLSILLSLASKQSDEYKNPTVIHFAVQGKTNARSELCAAHRFKPNLSILLGAKDLGQNAILLKDGKHVLPLALKKRILNSAFETVHRIVSDDRITKASDLTTFGYPVISLALSARNVGKRDETVSETDAKELLSLIERILNESML